jgi:flagellar hook assembly protein FlgD
LLKGYPNPFRESIRFVLGGGIPDQDAVLELFDVQGRRIGSWQLGSAAGGTSTLLWDGRDEAGVSLPAGVYFARVDPQGSNLRVVYLK